MRVENLKPNSTIFKGFDSDDMIYDQKFTDSAMISENIGKDKKGYSTSFAFLNMRDTHKKMVRNEMDGLIYNKVSASVFMNGESHNFWFYIKNYHQIMSYTMFIVREKEGLRVKVVDKHYGFKRDLFESNTFK